VLKLKNLYVIFKNDEVFSDPFNIYGSMSQFEITVWFFEGCLFGGARFLRACSLMGFLGIYILDNYL